MPRLLRPKQPVQLALDLSPASTLCAASAMRAPAVPLVGGTLAFPSQFMKPCGFWKWHGRIARAGLLDSSERSA